MVVVLVVMYYTLRQICLRDVVHTTSRCWDQIRKSKSGKKPRISTEPKTENQHGNQMWKSNMEIKCGNQI